MKYILFAAALIASAFASNLEVTANSFYHKDGEKKAVFSGNVVAKEEGNLIKANKITVYLDENSEAKEYVASGNVYFELKAPKRFIKGRCSRIRYVPIADKYYLEGNVAVEDVLNKRKIYGDEIIIDNKNGASYAKSTKNRPVKFVFKVQSKPSKKTTKRKSKKHGKK
jgi:lipopolysaccharide transport protein LptA